MAPWIAFALLGALTAISIALMPKPAEPPPASLSDFDAPTAEEGRAIAWVFGTVYVKGPNVVWYGDLRTTPIKSKGGGA